MCNENDFPFPDSYDYLTITDGGTHTFDVYCGDKTGESIEVAGDHIVLTFHSDDIVQLKGFLIFFTAVPLGKYSENVMLCFRSFAVYRQGCFSSARGRPKRVLDRD